MIEQGDTADYDLVAAVKAYMEMIELGVAPSPEEYASTIAPSDSELIEALQGLLMVHNKVPVASRKKIDQDCESDFSAEPIGDYQIIREIGRGGMGVVYEAKQRSLGRRVALKILPFASGLDEVRLQRFRNEAHAAAALHHTNIVPVYAIGQERGVHYYAMQLIEGQTLAELVATMKSSREQELQLGVSPTLANTRLDSTFDFVRGSGHDTVSHKSRSSTAGAGRTNASRERLNYYRWAVQLTVDAALALDHAHKYGVIHRDIKPSNLILDPSGKIWLTDFGLAQIESDSLHLTRSGDPIGTIRYMSPEQAQGRRVALDHRTDIYSLGITLYELLTLRPAFDADNFRELLNQVAQQEPPRPQSIEPALPVELDTLIRKAIAKSPDERYATAKAFAEDMQHWLDDKPIVARPPNVVERFAKWRRRNSGLVTALGVIFLIISLSSLITTAMVWRAQHLTKLALLAEQEQRQQAEAAFRQARSAVDTYSQLSESELVMRPDMQFLRREFLEVSLDFYQKFLDQYANTPALRLELERASERVKAIVSELQALDDLAPYLLLSYVEVQDALRLAENEREGIADAVRKLQLQRHALWEQTLDNPKADGNQMKQLLVAFEASISQHLTEKQLTRLLQISRQLQLPFVFKTPRVIKALDLSLSQQDEIQRLIIANRPRLREPFDAVLMKRSPLEAAMRVSQTGDVASADMVAPMLNSQRVENTVQTTTAAILQSLTGEQRKTWAALVGEPFRISEEAPIEDASVLGN